VILAVLAAGAAPATAGVDTSRFVLVDGRKPAATIVIPAGGDAVNRRAAEILQDAVQRMSG
jgi:hypothetical protein